LEGSRLWKDRGFDLAINLRRAGVARPTQIQREETRSDNRRFGIYASNATR
jgi:hypothetical protein